MNKTSWILAGLCLVMAVAIVGCGSKSDSSAAQDVNTFVLAEDWEAVWRKLSASDVSQDPISRILLEQAAHATNRRYNPEIELDTLEANSDLNQWQHWTSSFVSEHPENPVAVFLAGDAAARRQSFQDAKALFTQAIELQPDYAMALNSRGAVKHAIGMTRGGLEDYDLAIRSNPEFALAYMNRGNFYRLIGEFDKAAFDYSKVIQLCEDNAEAYNNRGEVSRQKGDLEVAEADFSAAIAADPNLAISYNNRGLVRLQLGNGEMAFEDLNKGVDLDPDNPLAYYNRAIGWFQGGQFDSAIVDNERAIAIDSMRGEFYFNKAAACEKAGRLEEAIVAYERYADLAPEDQAEHAHRARLMANTLRQKLEQ